MFKKKFLDKTTIDCDFETDFICGYKSDLSQKMTWTRFTGQTITLETGPPNGNLLLKKKNYYSFGKN